MHEYTDTRSLFAVIRLPLLSNNGLVEMGILKKPFFQDLNSYFDAKQKIWSGKTVNPLFDKDVSVGQVAMFVLGINPHKVVQICDTTGEQLTSQNLAKFGIRLAQHFRLKLGLQQEDVIGIMANSTTYVAPVVLGAFLAGTPINPLHHTLDRNTVKQVYGLTKPKVVFCDSEAYNELTQGLDDVGLSCKIYTLRGHINGVANVQDLLHEIDTEENFVPPVLKNGGEQTAAILCTSGTTGVPKGVCVSHQSLLNRRDLSFMTSDDVLLTFSSIYWITGLWFLIRTFISGSSRIITDRPFSPEYFLELVEKYRITQIFGPPANTSSLLQCPDIAHRDLSSLQTYICGGAPLSVSVSKKLSKYLRKHCLCEAFGLSELGVSNMNKLLLEKEGSVGRLTPNTKAKILADDGKTLGIGETGELHLWCPYKWNGYYKSPEKTRQTLDALGWVKTGDMGYFDEDGFLFICGRQKDMMKHRNYLISPIEIEEVIQNIPGVIEVCVFGVPDQMEEDLITAAIIKSPECPFTEKDFCAAVANRLPEAKHLRGGVYFVQELPKTPSGKIQRHKMLQIVGEFNSIK